MRLPPGYELAHQRGCEAQKGFDYSYTMLTDKYCHKLQHKYDRVGGVPGARNKTFLDCDMFSKVDSLKEGPFGV